MPCWSVGWWLWREGCISHETYLLYQDYYSDQRFPFTHPPSNLQHDIYMLIMTWPWPSPTWTCSCLAKVEASHLRTSSGTDSLTWRGNILINGQVTIARGGRGDAKYEQWLFTISSGRWRHGGRKEVHLPYQKFFFKGTFWIPCFFVSFPIMGTWGWNTSFTIPSKLTNSERSSSWLSLKKKNYSFCEFLSEHVRALSTLFTHSKTR